MFSLLNFLYAVAFLLLALVTFSWIRCGNYQGGWLVFAWLFFVLFLLFGLYGLYIAFNSPPGSCTIRGF